jgi:hypothetical protein
MKIRKRHHHRPAVFGSLTDQIPTQPAAGGSAPESSMAPFADPPPEPEQFGPPPMPEAAEPLQRSASSQVARRSQRAPARQPEPSYAPPASTPEHIPPAWPIYFAAFVVSVLWACGPIAFAVGYRRDVIPFHNDLFALAVFALLSIGPAAFVWIAAYVARQGQKLGSQARRANELADELTTPALAAAARTGDVVLSIREEIVRAGEAAEEARDTLLALREALAQETERLHDAASTSVRSAQSLATTLGLERTEMGVLAESLDKQAVRVSDVITQQARMVAEASDLAQTQLREAEASLAARAADLAAAAAEASDAARTAGEDLNRHVVRLETAGLSVADQIRTVETGLSAHRSALMGLAEALRADHQGFADEADTHAAKLSEFITQARLSAVEMGDRALKGGEALRAMVAEAAEQFRTLTEASQAERNQFGQAAVDALGQMSDAATLERARLESQTRAAIESLNKAAEETRAAAATHAEAARHHVDQLSEVAFTAGQKANQAFEARLDEAKRLIEQSAQMIDQAGAATARKLEDGAAAARSALEELQRMLADVEARTAALPAAALGQAEQVRAAVAGSMDELMQQAQRAAAETQAIDEAFQARVRRNYEMLSEAVRLMGSVAAMGGLQPAPAAPAAPAPAPVAPPPPAPPPRRATEAPPPQPDAAARPPEPAPQPEPPPTTSAAPAPFVEPADARPRLRLTPTATDEEFASIFEASGGRLPDDNADGDGWTWKDLLSSIDEAEGADPAKLEQTLVREITEMGIDPVSLMPRAKIDEIAAVVQMRDVQGAREVVRALAPAANRRVARRLFTDEKLKRQTLTFLGRYRGLLEEAAQRDRQGFEVAKMLNTDGGRAYLVLEAAAGDIS